MTTTLLYDGKLYDLVPTPQPAAAHLLDSITASRDYAATRGASFPTLVTFNLAAGGTITVSAEPGVSIALIDS